LHPGELTQRPEIAGVDVDDLLINPFCRCEIFLVVDMNPGFFHQHVAFHEAQLRRRQSGAPALLQKTAHGCTAAAPAGFQSEQILSAYDEVARIDLDGRIQK
jgi:hypothetical protein